MTGLGTEETGFLEPDEPAPSLTAPRYRKTATVEARYFDPRKDYDGACAVVAWCGGTATDEGCLVPTLEGPVLASPGYMILKDERGNCWPVRGDLFEADYEMVPDGEPRTRLTAALRSPSVTAALTMLESEGGTPEDLADAILEALGGEIR